MTKVSEEELMPFGIFKGQPLKDIRASYLLWYYEQKWARNWPDVYFYVEQNYDQLVGEAKEDE